MKIQEKSAVMTPLTSSFRLLNENVFSRWSHLLGTAFADFTGLVGDAERPWFALAPRVRRPGAMSRFDLICGRKKKKKIQTEISQGNAGI